MTLGSWSAGFLGPLPSGRRVSLWWMTLPLAFLVVMLLFFPFRRVFEFDVDEGLEAIKAILILRGFPLYSQVWSDQPPLFTFLLSLWFSLFGPQVVAGRLLTLALSAVLIGAIVVYLREAWGGAAAMAGVALIVILPLYRSLSVSIMTGLPAIALATLSFVTHVAWHRRRRTEWLVLSAVFLAASVLTKAFTAVLVPIWLAGLALASWQERKRGASFRHAWGPVLGWAMIFGLIVGLCLLAVVRPENIHQLVQTHLEAGQAAAYQPSVFLPSISVQLEGSLALLAVALVGVIWGCRERTWSVLYLAGWAVAGYVLLLLNHPAWSHQQLLITVPAAGLAAVAVGLAVRELFRQVGSVTLRKAGLAASMLTLALFSSFLVQRGPTSAREFERGFPNLSTGPTGDPEQRQLLAYLIDHAEDIRWVYTDRPMFAFRAGLLVPPYLAMLSQKRILTGTLAEADIRSSLEDYRPEVILIGRFHLPAVDEFIHAQGYTPMIQTERYQLYLRPGRP